MVLYKSRVKLGPVEAGTAYFLWIICGTHDSGDVPADNTPNREVGAKKGKIGNEVLTSRPINFSISLICFSPSHSGQYIGVVRLSSA